MPQKYSQEFRARAVRLVQDRLEGDPGVSVSAVLTDTAGKLGIAKETLRRWYCQDQVDTGRKLGITSEENAEIRRLRKENAELRRTNEILKRASLDSNRQRNTRLFGFKWCSIAQRFTGSCI